LRNRPEKGLFLWERSDDMGFWKNKKSVVCVSIFLLAMLLITGCSPDPEKVIEEVVEDLIEAENQSNEAQSGESAIEAEVDIDSGGESVNLEVKDEDFSMEMDSTSNMEWPSDIPSHVPPLHGDINSIVEANEDGVAHYQIYFENVPVTDMDEYIRTLESGNDWQVSTQMKYDEGWMIQAMMEVGDDFWSLTVACMGDGDGSMQITFRP